MASKDTMKGEGLDDAMKRVSKDSAMSEYTKKRVLDKLKKRKSASFGMSGDGWEDIADASED